MRRFIISILLIACVALAVAQQPKPYITRWKLKANETIEIPLIGSNFSYRWYKANQDPASATAKVATTWLPNNALKVTAETEGEYILEAGPDGVAAMQFIYGGVELPYAEKLQAIEQWGTVRWTTFNGAYGRCINMNFTEQAGIPDLSNVSDLFAAFTECKSFNGPVGQWDVSTVKDIARMFDGCIVFNQDLSAWDVRRVESMWATFRNCHAFNSNITTWKTPSLTNLASAFENATIFNQDISRWNTDKVTDMTATFNGANDFNQRIGKWNVSNVTRMFGIFQDAKKFNQSLAEWTPSKIKEISFTRSGVSAANYGATIIAWAQKVDQQNTEVDVMAEGMFYPPNDEVTNAINILTTQKQWRFKNHNPYVHVTSITITNNTPIIVRVGNMLPLFATVVPSNANDPQITWSSDHSEYASVDAATGLVTAHAEGTVTITATADGISQSVQVTVVKEPVTSITLTPSEAQTLKIGSTLQLSTEVLPANATYKTVAWSSDHSEYASVDAAAGLVMAHAEGTATITAMADGISQTVQVMVVKEPVTSITLTPSEAQTFKIGSTLQLSAEVLPANATYRTVAWSSDHSEYASVDATTGLVMAHAEGTATITAMADGISQMVQVTVVKEPVASITLTPSEAQTLKIGSTLQLSAEVLPANATYRTVAWSSDHSEYASVDAATGLVMAHAEGTATITAMADGISQMVQVTVVKDLTPEPTPEPTQEVPKIERITLSKDTLVLGIGQNKLLEAFITPFEAASLPVEWKSDNEPVATVEAGRVYAKAEGRASIIVQTPDASVRDTCHVTVMKDTEDVTDATCDILAQVEVYPNPFTTTVQLRQALHAVRYELYAANGVLVHSALTAGQESLALPVATLRSGVYLLTLYDAAGGRRTVRIVKR